MRPSPLHLLHQAPTISAMTRTAISAARHVLSPIHTPPSLPSPKLTQTLHPRSPALVDAYIQHISPQPELYTHTLPPHLFPQWAFGLAARTLTRLPYNPAHVVNGGCSLSIRGPIPRNSPLVSTAQLLSIDDNGARAVLHQTIATGPPQQPDALSIHLFPIVRLSKTSPTSTHSLSLPPNATRLHSFSFTAHHARSFALLTGDINPIHWLKPYARAAGFSNTILHGFATLAHTFEALLTQPFDAPSQIAHIDVRFKRPLALPANVHLYTAPHPDLPHRTLLHLTDHPDQRPFLTGYVERQQTTTSHTHSSTEKPHE